LDGKTWFRDTIVFAGYGGSYPDAVELEPGKLLYVYDVDGFREAGQKDRPRNYLRIATITLRPPVPGRGLIPFPIARYPGRGSSTVPHLRCSQYW
jgi:hypothetical protein